MELKVFVRMADGLDFTYNLPVGVKSEIGSFSAHEMVQNRGGHIKQPGALLSKNRHVKCSTGASLRMEERRVETKRRVSGQRSVGDKFKETRKLLKNVWLKHGGEESCSQIGHQEKKKKKHILLRELTSWTPKLH